MTKSKPAGKTFKGIGKIFGRFWPYIRKFRLLIAGSLTALLGEILFRLLEPWPLKFVFDRIIPVSPTNEESGIAFLDSLESGTLLLFAALAIVAFSGLRALTSYAHTIGFALVGNRVLTKIRRDLYNHIQCLPLSFHNRSRKGDLLVRIIGDVGLLQEVASTAALPLFGNLLALVCMFGVMLWLNWQLSLAALVVVPLFWLTTIRIGGKIRDASRKQRKTESDMAATAAESMAAIHTVQALSLEQAFTDSFSSNAQRSLKEGIKAKRLAAGLERTVDILIGVSTALVLWYGAVLVTRNVLSPGDLIVFLAYLKNAFKPLKNFSKYTGRLAKASAAGERVIELMDLAPEIRDHPDAVPAKPFQGSVRFENVSFAYEPGYPTLQGIDFEVQPGQRIGLVAPSGSGKSTLVSMILRLYDPDQGRVLIDGGDVRFYTLDSLRPQISVVLQDTILFAASVYDNITYGATDVSPEEVEAAARMANAHEFIMAMPKGYDSVMGERGVTLSNGQRQRIAIARAAIRNSPILILDEPTTGLDKENEREVASALEKLSRGATTFLITHDLHQVSKTDIIIYMENGCLREIGSHSELMKADGPYAAVYQLHHQDSSTETVPGHAKEDSLS